MNSRRGALLRLGLGLLSGAWAVISCAPLRRRSRPPSPPEAESAMLEQDLARLGQRAYSDQGIPVLLVGENLATAHLNRGRMRGVNPGDESARLAREFHRMVEWMQRLRPERTEDDVPKLIEVLADRDLRAHAVGKRPEP